MPTILLPRGKSFYWKRISSAYADSVNTSSVLVLYGLLAVFRFFHSISGIKIVPDPLKYISIPFTFTLIVFLLLTIILKDVVDTQSYGKAYAGLQVVDFESGLQPTSARLILRNIPLLLIFDGLLLLFGWNRRLGDILAKTVVVHCEVQYDLSKKKLMKYIYTLVGIICAFLVEFIFSFF
jgi:uncharacterized RDD family membrane protein YckC